MYVLEELGLESEIVIAIAREVAAKQVAAYKAGDRRKRLLGDYNRTFSTADFAAPYLVPAEICNMQIHAEYRNLVDSFRKEMFIADRNKV